MKKIERAKWAALGYKTKQEIGKLHPALVDWNIFSKTFGFYQFKTKNQMTEQQIEDFKFGFEHTKGAESSRDQNPSATPIP